MCFIFGLFHNLYFKTTNQTVLYNHVIAPSIVVISLVENVLQVHRVWEYDRLLSQLMNYTPDSHPDYPDLHSTVIKVHMVSIQRIFIFVKVKFYKSGKHTYTCKAKFTSCKVYTGYQQLKQVPYRNSVKSYVLPI